MRKQARTVGEGAEEEEGRQWVPRGSRLHIIA
jgi:hypothetical protein